MRPSVLAGKQIKSSPLRAVTQKVKWLKIKNHQPFEPVKGDATFFPLKKIGASFVPK
jgi:hypothetical protein